MHEIKRERKKAFLNRKLKIKKARIPERKIKNIIFSGKKRYIKKTEKIVPVPEPTMLKKYTLGIFSSRYINPIPIQVAPKKKGIKRTR
ncbi:hypothetical protein J7L81_02050 [Candidatus Aerophobetes bacterium]|nr:hypothetical protein [Candidatus Aerophobetes bacterium]